MEKFLCTRHDRNGKVIYSATLTESEVITFLAETDPFESVVIFDMKGNLIFTGMHN